MPKTRCGITSPNIFERSFVVNKNILTTGKSATEMSKVKKENLSKQEAEKAQKPLTYPRRKNCIIAGHGTDFLLKKSLSTAYRQKFGKTE
eukprot:4679372-Amphidinium_carterae.1